MEELYRDILDEHARNPRGRLRIERPDFTGTWSDLKTGNRCEVQGKIHQDRFSELSAFVEGSALARACASIMCSSLLEKAVSEGHAILAEILRWMEEGIEPPAWKGDLGLYRMLSRFPERRECSLLGWRALAVALRT